MTTTRVGSLTVELSTDAADFAARARGLFAADPVGTSVVASWSTRAAHADRPSRSTWMLVDSGEGLVGAAMHTPPYPPYLPPMPAAAAAALAEALHGAGASLPGVNGDASATAAFTERWTTLADERGCLTVAEGIHVLDVLSSPQGVTGAARVAGADQLDLVLRWYQAFGNDIGMHRPPLPEALVRSRVAEGLIMLWVDPEAAPVSMAGWSSPLHGVSRVGPVYTPPAQRRHGYAAAVTAEAAQCAQAAGAEQVMLYTDLANPTSNGVYARLGFRRVGDASEWLFQGPAPTA